MDTAELLEKIGSSLGSTATVKSVFGEPIQAQGKTVVPVAKVAYGFGAGGGRSRRHQSTQAGEAPEGGGGGGGVRAFPAGALEITQNRTRFIPYTDLRWIAGAFLAGAAFAGLLWRRGR
jgi:uncharacterized spore protein YtfJ